MIILLCNVMVRYRVGLLCRCILVVSRSVYLLCGCIVRVVLCLSAVVFMSSFVVSSNVHFVFVFVVVFS